MTDIQIPAGYGALEVWNAEAMANAPMLFKMWLAIMGLSFLSSIFFVRSHKLPRYALVSFVSGLCLTKFVLPQLGITVYSGLVALIHVLLWLPVLILILKKGLTPQLGDWYSRWRLWLGTVISISMFFDIRDATLFILNFLS